MSKQALNAGVIAIMLLSLCCGAQAQKKSKQQPVPQQPVDTVVNMDIDKQRLRRNKPLEDQLGYTQAIRTGNTIFISGTMAAGYMPDQLREIMNGIKNDLGRYGASMQNVVKQTIYTTDLDSLMENKIIIKSFYNGDYPTSSIVEVKRLLLPQFKVLIEVTAILPKED